MSQIDEYLSTLNQSERTELQRIRDIIITTVPEATETTSYGIPTFLYKGKHLIGFYVYRQYISLFPTAYPISVMKSKLAGYKLSRGTIQFTLAKTIPEPVIRGLILCQIDQIDRIVNKE